MEFGLYFLEEELAKKRFKNKLERYDWCEQQMQKVITDFLKDKGIAASEEDNTFLEDLDEKVWINPELNEHQEVEQFVCGFINKALQKLQEKNLDFDLKPIKLIKSGSYYSNHRVGRPYEFDYLLELPNDNLILKENDNGDSIFIYAGLRADKKKWPFVERCSLTVESEPDWVLVYIFADFKKHLLTNLFDCINTVKKDYDGVEILRNEGDGNSEPPALTFDMYYNNKSISVDLVPCFKYPYNKKNYEEYIPPAKQRLWEFLNRALADKSSIVRDGPLETNLEGMKTYLYRDTLKSEMGDDISDSNSSCSKNSGVNGSNITPKDDNQLLGEASSGMISGENNEGIESEKSICKEIKLEEKSPEKTLPAKSNEFDRSTKPIKMLETTKNDKAYSFFKDNLYLVIADKTSGGYLGDLWIRLSTSLIENFIFSELDDQLVRSLRIVKYILQTFHIAILEVQNLDRAEKMGVPSIFPSRWITVIFLNLVLESDLFRTKLNLTERVAYLLFSLVKEGYRSLREQSNLGLFDFKRKYEEYSDDEGPVFLPQITITWAIFKESNLHTLLDFFITCMHRKQLDVLHLTSLPNTCMCSICFNEIYNTPFRSHRTAFQWKKLTPESERNYAANYPHRFCFMHEYILNERILCYERYQYSDNYWYQGPDHFG